MGAVLTATLIAPPAGAVTYTIDSSLSSLTLGFTVDINGTLTPLQGQIDVPTAGGGGDDLASKTTSLSGTIETTIYASPTQITLASGLSNIDADINSNIALFGHEFLPTGGTGSLDPGKDDILADGSVDPLGNGDGVFTAGEDNFGFQLDVTLAIATAAIRNFALTAEGSGDPSVVGTGTGIGFNVSDGWAAFDPSFLFDPGETSMINTSDPATFNDPSDLAFSTDGTTDTITIPIAVLLDLGDGQSATLSGVIVATTATIPEPATLALFGVGLCSSLLVRRRSRVVS